MDNIKLRKDNFVVDSGYFYTFDDDQDAILQKTADGNTAFSYPCDTVLNAQVVSLEYDGVNFWTMESSTDNIYIKRWKVDNYISKLQDTFHYESSGVHIYDSKCFTVEHYHTKLTTTVSGGDTTLYIDNYSNVPNIIEDAVLHIGPNINGEEEDVEVDHTVFGGVVLKAPLEYFYDAESSINFHRHIWIFNNNNGSDASTGALYKFDAHTGGYMDKYAGGAYKDISACTFYKIKSFQDIGIKDMLMYIKGTNTLFVNVEEEKKTLYDATTVNDDFSSGVIDTERWLNEYGSPSIYNEQLELTVTSSGITEGLRTKYYVPDDFDVYILGDLSSYDTTYSGIGYQENYMEITYPNEQDRFCRISRGYNSVFDSSTGHSFTVSSLKDDEVLNDYITISGSNDATSYGIRLKRVEADVHLYYTTATSGIYDPWTYMTTVTMFDSDAQLIIASNNTTSMPVTNYFDEFTFTEGKIAYVSVALELPYFGSMVMDNIEDDGFTIIPIYDMSVDRNNLYRLEHHTNTYSYALSPLDSFVTSISLSASPAVIAANGLSTSDIKAWVKDQFLQPIVGRRVTFSAEHGSISPTTVNTDSDGFAQTEYTSSTWAGEVEIKAVVQQTN
jgi:hypothetical protein